MDDERLKTWEILFQRALILIDDTRARGIPVDDWTNLSKRKREPTLARAEEAYNQGEKSNAAAIFRRLRISRGNIRVPSYTQ